mgnify:CR=1 FL=1|tara:strand:+ start:6788 stop:6988 length:201 start_codon:yes stop_codon:yes gene_type:complete
MAEPLVDRLKKEGKELRAKMYALAGFLQSTAGQNLPTEKRMLMEKKLKFMGKYSDIQDELVSLEES